MEVFSKYFRRLVTGNAPQIFPGMNKPVENPGNYPLLVGELRKIAQDPDQSRRIAEALDTSDGDVFKDFDLSNFLEHFKLDPVEKTVLALAVKTASKPDLRTKADAILSNNFRRLLDLLPSSSADNANPADITPATIARILEGFGQHPPPNFTDDSKTRLSYAVRLRYQNVGAVVPPDVLRALQAMDILGPRHALAWTLNRLGPNGTSSLQGCRMALQSATTAMLDEENVAHAILSMIMVQNWVQNSLTAMVIVIREHSQTPELDWNKVVRHLDKDQLRINRAQFLALYHALLPVARDDPRFDLQLLWGGKWRHPDTQLSFVGAFVTLTSEQLDATKIPQLRAAFSITDYEDADDEVKDVAARAVKHPLVSLDAILAIFNLILPNSDFLMTASGQQVFQDLIQANVDIFLSAAMAVPKPWTETQHEILTRLFIPFFLKQHPNYDFVLHGLWKRDRQWVAKRVVDGHVQDPMKLPLILEHAHKHNWLGDLVMLQTGFAMDLVALAHRQGLVDLDKWAQSVSERGSASLVFLTTTLLTIKAEDEVKIARKELSAQKTVALSVKTVHALIDLLEEWGSDDGQEFVELQRKCIGAYPRLINYGEGFDEIIDANGAESNAMSDAIDKVMREHFEAMYGGGRDVREIVEAMQRYKRSHDPTHQDLFACMIHGLFDEYCCYSGYPLEALATTAVLFGGIINFNLISGMPLRVALGMVLEAVRDHVSSSSMFKFGLQALLHFFGRLHEWPGFCNLLLRIPALQGTEAYAKAQEIVEERTREAPPDDGSSTSGNQNGVSEGAVLTNGDGSVGSGAGPTCPPFASLHVDPAQHDEDSTLPSEEVHDVVLFALNNLSEQNLAAKMKDLSETLQVTDYRWFARYLVEERAKMQPNYHKLYLDMLKMFADKQLWKDVLRETFVAVIRMLNSQAIMDSSAERAYLKNLATWLGQLTLARNKPILFKNISFRDLLIEAYDTQRLIIVIPFSCKVLAQACKSMIFKPPNAWTMEILRLLLELYHFAELKLQLKFEIEVLCKDLKLDHRTIEPSTALRDRPIPDEEGPGTGLSDVFEGFDDMSLAGLVRPSARGERYSPDTITASLPDIGSLLVLPPTSNTSITRDTLKYIVESSMRRAIHEIISPVVERSVTIAAISTSQLVHKDFAMEPNEERVRQAAMTMVRALAGSLALVTCKEPLRMSMTNYIRVISAEVEEQVLPEGAILMCVNDNLDAACSLVEKAAEDRALPQIEANLEQQLAARRQHRASRSTEPFVDPILNRWAFFIPEPYRQSPNGLNREQLAIYEDFARQARGPPAHVKTASADSGRNVSTEVLQDQFATVPSLSTPAEPPALPYQPSQHLHQPPRMQPLPPPTASNPLSENAQMNGFSQPRTTEDQIHDLVSELLRVANDATQTHLGDLPADSPVHEIEHQILHMLAMSPNRDGAALMAGRRIYEALYTQKNRPLEVDILIHLLKEVCSLNAPTAREITLWFTRQDDEPLFNSQIVLALLKAGLVDLHRIDLMTAKGLQLRDVGALEFLNDLMDQLLFCDWPVALRADFANSLEILGEWSSLSPSPPTLEHLLHKLRAVPLFEAPNSTPEPGDLCHRDQVRYAFLEWTRLCTRPQVPDKAFVAFVVQLHHQQLINNEDDACTFFRVCMEMAVEAFDDAGNDPDAHFGDSFNRVDALAKLVMLLTKYRGQADGEVKGSRTVYLSSMLTLIVLVLNHHHVTRQEKFAQRVFFRFFSSFLFEYHIMQRLFPDEHPGMMLVIGTTIAALQPTHFPGFIFAWLTLISHRFFMPAMLLLPDQAGWESYAKALEAALSYAGDLLKPLVISQTGKDIYRGLLRILLVLHHDFPEFLAQNYFRLCGAVPPHCAQLRNLILSAYPASFPDLPDPFAAGLKIDRLEQIRTSPTIAGDHEAPLREANLLDVVESALEGHQMEDHVARIVAIVEHPATQGTGVAFVPINVDVKLIDSLVLYVGIHAIARASDQGQPFVRESPDATLLLHLGQKLSFEGRYYFFSAIANHLRYPNTHTHYFSHALLFLFGGEQHEQQPQEGFDIKQGITRVLLERLIVHRPHPWGLIITLLELLKNPAYSFWNLPFIKAVPEVERLFNALFTHINQAPR
ncbi:MAG: hypothetical protein M1826_002857 [Phylliscum demangeonii]|nr:MAG: hypothetical protein M1826_002857 [Phylliscum demangeonii]